MVAAIPASHQIRVYDANAAGRVAMKEGDLLLGHPMPDARTKDRSSNHWGHPDCRQIFNRTLAERPRDPAIHPIFPYNGDAKQTGWLRPVLSQAQQCIGICGDPWARHATTDPVVQSAGRFVHVPMAIDRRQYPPLKKAFAPPGKRKFLYIGRVSDEKNTAMLSALARNDHFVCDYVGGGQIENCHQIAKRLHFDVQTVRDLCERYDVFISPSRFDAQATTVLEAMSWGLAVAATPTSGYEHESIFRLDADDQAFNQQQIEIIQSTSNEELEANQQQNFELLETKYSWTHFQDRLRKHLEI